MVGGIICPRCGRYLPARTLRVMRHNLLRHPSTTLSGLLRTPPGRGRDRLILTAIIAAMLAGEAAVFIYAAITR